MLQDEDEQQQQRQKQRQQQRQKQRQQQRQTSLFAKLTRVDEQGKMHCRLCRGVVGVGLSGAEAAWIVHTRGRKHLRVIELLKRKRDAQRLMRTTEPQKDSGSEASNGSDDSDSREANIRHGSGDTGMADRASARSRSSLPSDFFDRETTEEAECRRPGAVAEDEHTVGVHRNRNAPRNNAGGVKKKRMKKKKKKKEKKKLRREQMETANMDRQGVDSSDNAQESAAVDLKAEMDEFERTMREKEAQALEREKAFHKQFYRQINRNIDQQEIEQFSSQVSELKRKAAAVRLRVEARRRSKRRKKNGESTAMAAAAHAVDSVDSRVTFLFDWRSKHM